LGLNIKDIVPLVEEQINSGGYFYLVPKGVSMLPTIKGDVDTVTLEKADELKKGDIVLYGRENGQIVLHRIVSIKGDSLILSGDAQIELEHGIKKSDVIARVCEIKKGERIIKRSSFEFKRLYSLSRISRAAKIYRSRIRKAVKRNR
jgi:SOS-response transcriptional repressor LexA